MAYKIITKATVEPVSLAEARAHLRIETFGSPAAHPDDDQIELMITSAREWCEQYTGRAFAEQTIDVAYDDFPENEIAIPLSPCTSITSVKYADTSNVEQTVSSSLYGLDDFSKPNFVVLTPDAVWPTTNGGANNVKIRAVVGDAPEDTPFPVKSAILLIVGNLYENRQEDQLGTSRASFNSLPMGVFNLLQPYRINLGV
jgi:uncharacterized phiE125 gp8 family phage protein